MCGTLKFEKRASRIGDLVSVFALNTNRQGTAKWSGFAQEEKLYWWLRSGVPVHIMTHSFLERDLEFGVPGMRIQAIGIKKDVWVNNKLIAPARSVKLVTRVPLSDYESRIHKRWPLVFYPRNSTDPYIFSQREEGTHRSLFA